MLYSFAFPAFLLVNLPQHVEVLIPEYVKDQTGKSQDLVIMTCDIQELWKELDQFYMDSDWERCR